MNLFFDESMFKVDFYLRIKLSKEQYLKHSKTLTKILHNEASDHINDIHRSTTIDSDTIEADLRLLNKQFRNQHKTNIPLPEFVEKIKAIENPNERKFLLKALIERVQILLADFRDLIENTTDIVDLSNVKKGTIYENISLNRSQISKRKFNPELWKLQELEELYRQLKS